jgi:Domain of unknown function (DUF4115)
MAKRSSVRSKENSPDLTPIPEDKSGSKKKPYVFTRAFARLLSLNQEQAVAGYLASTSRGEPNPTLPETALPSRAPSGSNTGRPIPSGEVRKPETPNPNIKLPPGRVTGSASTQGKSDRAAVLPNPNAPSDPSAGRPISPNGVHIRKVTEISKSPNTKSRPGVTESAPAQGKSDPTSIPQVNEPSDSNTGRPIAQKKLNTHKAMEMPSPANLTLVLLGAARTRARVKDSAPTQGEGSQAGSLQAAPDSSTTRPITQDGIEIRKGTETPSSANMKLPPSAQIQERVAESTPAQGEGGPASSPPKAKAASDGSGRPIIQSGVEIRKGAETPSSANMKLPPSAQIHERVLESEPQGEGGRASSLPKTKAASDSSTTRPIAQDGVEIRKGAEIPSSVNMKFAPSPQIQAKVVESVPVEESGHTSTVPNANAASESSTTRPITQDGVEIRKGTEIPSPANMKFPPSPQIQAKVVESVPVEESGHTSTVPNANAASESSTEQAIIQNRVEIRKFVEVPNPNLKFPAGELAESPPAQEESGRAGTVPNANTASDSSTGLPIIQNRVEIRKFVEVPNPNLKFLAGELAESPPAQEESGRAGTVPSSNAASESGTGRPIIQNRVEIRKFVEVPNPNLKFPAGELAESPPVQEKSGRASTVPSANAASESSTGRPIIQNRVEIRKFVEVPNPNLKFTAGELAESAPEAGESGRAASLPKANGPSESSTTRPVTQQGIEVRKVTGIPNPSKRKVPPSAQIQERLAILVLVVALGVTAWGFLTREPDTRVMHTVSPDSNSSASVASADTQMPFSNKASGSSASRGMASFVVGIKAQKSVWVSIWADGRKLTEEKLTSSTEKFVTAANQVMVKTGNPGALDFEFNGKKLPSQATSGSVQTLEFGPSGLEVVISHSPTRMKPGK